MFWASSNNLQEISISVAPPPGTSLGLTKTFLATPRASYKFLSISLRTSFEAPLKRIVQAFGFLHSVMNEKYSSPIFLISKSPQSVPTSLSYNSSGLLTMVAPQTLEILLLSVFLILLMTVQLPPFIKKC